MAAGSGSAASFHWIDANRIALTSLLGNRLDTFSCSLETVDSNLGCAHHQAAELAKLKTFVCTSRRDDLQRSKLGKPRAHERGVR